MINPTLNRIIENQVANLTSFDFQEFCERMLRVRYPDFTVIRPGGPNGDGKKDGLCSIDKRYFQCYATKGINKVTVEKKMRTSLKECIEENGNVKEFIFLSNHERNHDKHVLIEELKEVYGIKVDYWGAFEISWQIQQFQPNEIDYVLGYSLSEAALDFRKQPIFYSEDESTITEISVSMVKKGLRRALFSFITWVLLLVIGRIIELEIFDMIFVGVTVIFVGSLAFHLRYGDLLSIPVQGEKQLSNGDFLFRPTKETGLLYTLRAKCIFPNCKGIVRLYPAPVMEKQKYNRRLIGRCSIDRNEHTYTFDANRTGLFKEFDHSPIVRPQTSR